VKAFWGNRAAAVAKQKELGRADQGERAGVTAGKNMDGFIALIQDVIRANGLTDAHMMLERRLLTLPGFFRPTKLWDLLIVKDGRLIAALELKSQVGPSCGRKRRLAPRLVYGRPSAKGLSAKKLHAPLSAG
jgi:type II restriction enzyme